MSEQVKDILKQFTNFVEKNRYIVAIDGLSRSGKTTIVNKIRHYLEEEDIPYYIFHMDDHIVERKHRYETGREQWYEYYQLQWDVEWLSQNFFHKLQESTEMNLPFYNNQTDTLSMRKISIPDQCLIIVEGVFLQRKEWRNFFDYIIYLNCSREVRFSRESIQTQKDIHKFKERYWIAEDYYLKTEDPMKRANCVIEN